MDILANIIALRELFGRDKLLCALKQHYQKNVCSNYIVHYEVITSGDQWPTTVYIGFFNEISARIIGKRGLLIRRIRIETNTYIFSPQLLSPDKIRHQCFMITSDIHEDAQYATMVILYLAGYFYAKMIEQISPEPMTNQIQERVEVPSRLVPRILHRRGQMIVYMQVRFRARIVSPKPYSKPCYFFIVGEKENVKLAKECLINYINSIKIAHDVKKMPLKCIDTFFQSI